MIYKIIKQKVEYILKIIIKIKYPKYIKKKIYY